MKPDPASAGSPLLTPLSSRGLGLRVPRDVAPDENGMVAPASGGLSAFSDRTEIPPFLLPKRLGGPDDSMEVFSIETEQLAPTLTARNTHKSHYQIEPRALMPFATYIETIEATKPSWRIA